MTSHKINTILFQNNGSRRKNIMRLLQIYLVQLTIGFVICNIKDELLFKSKNTLPYFIREVERNSENPTIEIVHSDGSKTNLVSFFVDNAKEIFNDNDATEFYESILPTATSTAATETIKPTIKIIIKSNQEAPKLTENIMGYENISKVPGLINLKFNPVSTNNTIKTANVLPIILAKDINSLDKFERNLEDHALTSISSLVMKNTELFDPAGTWINRKSCILCNNIKSEDCNDPRHKLIQSVLCEHEDDICYSLHTPFGIIDRGCFNVDHNLTVYVCSCNLCNYLSSSEMPHIFTEKKDWVNNVVELSRTRDFRKSVFKDMACLRCEVNMTNSKGDVVESANCFEGNIGTVPTEVCKENEICAVKAIRNEGYLWRGCVSAPLYNYWFAFCDSDLCNYDSIVSLYDFI